MQMASLGCKIHRQVELQVFLCHGLRYTAEWRLPGVSYTTKLPFGSVRYTVEAIDKQMNATTALKGTNIQKTDQNFTFSSYGMVNTGYELKIC